MRGKHWWLAGYVALIVSIIALMLSARDQVMTQLGSPEAIAKWQVWRTDVSQQQAKPHSVERRVPKSAEPPALVLMRDYFAVSLFGAVLFSSALYWVMAWFISGIWSGSAEHVATHDLTSGRDMSRRDKRQ